MFCFFLIRYCIFGDFWFYIIPKWLIKVPGPFPILFGWFRELRKFCPNLDPQPSQLSPKYFKQYKKKYGIIFKNIICSYLNFLELRKNHKFWSTGPYLFFIFFVGIPPKNGISERFQRFVDVVWNLGIFGQSFFENI